MKIQYSLLLFLLLLGFTQCKSPAAKEDRLSDDALMDTVQRRTFNYFWEGAEPNSGLARERIHIDGVYPENDQNVITSGGSGFGIMAILAGIDRGYVTRQEGLERMEKIVSFLETADRFHGAYPHWWYGDTGKVKPFGQKDNGGDLVETAFIMQALLSVHQYYIDGSPAEQALAARIDKLWREVDWNFYRQNGQNVLYWHWSPEYGWEMNFPVHGYNECLIMYILAAASPTHGVPAAVYHEGWAQNGAIVDPHKVENIELHLRYQGTEAGPLFWAQYSFLETADRFHGAYPHWWYGDTGKVKPFGQKDNGGDLVETAFIMQALLSVHQYYIDGSPAEQALAARIDKLWREVDWNFYRQNGQNVLYWHWSPEYGWEMNFPVHGYNECLIMYILAAASPTHGVPAAVYHEGWAQNGAIVDPHKVENIELHLRYQGTEAGPLFWAQYSFLGLDPIGLKDEYCANYFDEMRNLTLVNRAYCVRNPKHYKGFGPDCWGLTASYSVNGYAAHAPNERDDQGVISPTAALSSIVYTPEQSLQVMRHLYEMGDKVFGPYGFYDAFSETDNWYPQRYLAIDQGPIAVMLENYRSGLLWKLFMSHPDVQKGLKELGFSTVSK